jgi:hypothetical protein
MAHSPLTRGLPQASLLEYPGAFVDVFQEATLMLISAILSTFSTIAHRAFEAEIRLMAFFLLGTCIIWIH